MPKKDWIMQVHIDVATLGRFETCHLSAQWRLVPPWPGLHFHSREN